MAEEFQDSREQPISPPSMWGEYNTPIPAEKQADYQKWLGGVNEKVGRDFSQDQHSYDVQGAFMSGVQPNENLHWPDTFKKPNHPTFSTDSQYHGEDGHLGGVWGGNNQEGWSFTPGQANYEHHGVEGLQDYFKNYEPNIKLNVPQQPAVPLPTVPGLPGYAAAPNIDLGNFLGQPVKETVFDEVSLGGKG